MITKIKIELQEDYAVALEGRKCWLKLKAKYYLDTDWYLIICPTEHKELNACAMENLCEFLKRKYKNKVLIVSLSEQKKDYAKQREISFEIVEEVLSNEEINSLLKYYRLLQFFPNIVVISNEEPFGNLNIVGKKGITMCDYVNYALFV